MVLFSVVFDLFDKYLVEFIFNFRPNIKIADGIFMNSDAEYSDLDSTSNCGLVNGMRILTGRYALSGLQLLLAAKSYLQKLSVCFESLRDDVVFYCIVSVHISTGFVQ